MNQEQRDLAYVRSQAVRWLLVMFSAAIVLEILRRYGIAHWVLYACWTVLGIWLLLLALCVPMLYYYLRRNPVSQLARLVRAKKYDEAVLFGESLRERQRTPPAEFNLGVAYRLAGKIEDARRLFEKLRARPDLPKSMREAIEIQMGHLARAEQGRRKSAGEKAGQ